MNIIVLQPRRSLSYAYFISHQAESVQEGQIENYGVSLKEKHLLIEKLQAMMSACSASAAGKLPDAIAIRVPFGGSKFDRPVIVSSHVVTMLEDLILHAPLHLPPVLTLIDCCVEAFRSIPIVLVFETAFFSNLPHREYLYALDTDLSRKWEFRRYGFHGIYHEAACSRVMAQSRQSESQSAPRTLSICLETQPELSAVIGRKPMTVTSGVTPLEGLPGQTSCGELDSSIILSLSEKRNWNPDKINAVLTQESGLKGLVGRPTSLEEVFTSQASEVRLAREMLQYRFLLASGAGIAAMGGLDRVVFSGRYADLGEILGPWLCSRLPLRHNHSAISGRDCWMCFKEPLSRIIADNAALSILALSSKVS